ncbi:unnamed protein product [Amoebophrya sp. A120]|nr:unnamed protein product [Amoebophrya sp. A120]|eukprot:GSA120T00008707001.1
MSDVNRLVDSCIGAASWVGTYVVVLPPPFWWCGNCAALRRGFHTDEQTVHSLLLLPRSAASTGVIYLCLVLTSSSGSGLLYLSAYR